MKQFEIWLVQYDTKEKRDITKSRHCIIISPDSLNKHLETVIVAPVTHVIREYPTRIPIKEVGEIAVGEIAIDQIRSVNKKRLLLKSGKVDKGVERHICSLLQVIFEHK